MGHIKAFLAAFFVTAALGLGWLKYSDFLTQGSKPPESTIKLNEMKESGLPKLDLIDIHNKPVSLEQYKGQVVIINFWASWCGPCVDEFPSLLQLINHFNSKVVIIAVSADKTKEDIQTFLKAFSVKSPYMRVVWDKDQDLAREFGTEILPESYIINKKGKLIRKIVGVDEWFTPSAKIFFKALIEEK